MSYPVSSTYLIMENRTEWVTDQKSNYKVTNANSIFHNNKYTFILIFADSVYPSVQTAKRLLLISL